MQKKDNPNQPGTLTFNQIISGEIDTTQVIERVLALGDQIGQLDKQILFYCINAIIHNRVEALPKMQLIEALKLQLHANQFWAAGALYYLIHRLQGQDIELSENDYAKIQNTLENDESRNCAVCATTEGLGFLNGWGGNGVDIELAKQAFDEAIKMNYTPARANLACVLILSEKQEEAYQLLTKESTTDCAVNYNLALIHLLGNRMTDANKRYKASGPAKDLNLLIGHGQISSVLMQRKQEKNVEFTAVTENQTATASERKRLKISQDPQQPSKEPEPKPRSGKQPFPTQQSGRQPASFFPRQNRFNRAPPNGTHDANSIDYKAAYEQSQKELAKTKEKLAKQTERRKKAETAWIKLRAKYKNLKTSLQAQNVKSIAPSEHSAFDKGMG